MNNLLSTSDLDVLILALNLLLRPSQQYSAQPAVSHALSISTTRLQSLARRWPHLGEHGIGLVNLAGNKGMEDLEDIPPEAREVNFNFYRTDTSSNVEPEKVLDESPEVPAASPRKLSSMMPASTQMSTAIHIRLEEQTVLAKPVMNVLADTIQSYSVPESETFELLCRIRSASSLSAGNRADREKLVVAHLLAIPI